MNLQLHNCDSLGWLKNHPSHSIDIILSSPPYNTNKKGGATLGKQNTKGHPTVRYDIRLDTMTNEEYSEWILQYFKEFERVLKPNGVILWNMNYGGMNTECMYLTLADIFRNTCFTMADDICWKKRSAIPNNVSATQLTRIWEHVFVLCRKDEIKTFTTNKAVKSVSHHGQKFYECYYNFIEARNNDGSNDLNKCTYSTELCEKLLSLYGKEGMVVLDPFSGTGTTGMACKNLGMSYIGIELSEAQTEYAKKRLEIVDFS